MKQQQLDDLVNTKALAKQLGKPVSSIQRWTRQRVIPVVKVGWRTRLYDLSAVRRALLKKTVREVE